MMFGYAINETPELMPMALAFSHRLLRELTRIRKEEKDIMTYLRPDAKAQVTIEYDENRKPIRVHTIVVSTQHDEFAPDEEMLARIRKDVIEILVPRVIPANLLDKNTVYHVNPTGKFVIGGPHGDSGLTGRKIIVDTYGGKGAHGGGAFSGKDPSKVDRSAAYATRHIAKNMVAAGIADEVLVQVAYAIGVAAPVSLNINTYGTAKVDLTDAEIAEKIGKIFDMRPKAIIERLSLKTPIYAPTAAYGHMGREPYRAKVPTAYTEISYEGNTRIISQKNELREFEFFTWEKTDYTEKLKKEFGL
jgi:S-adenosylmethionine synthetase